MASSPQQVRAFLATLPYASKINVRMLAENVDGKALLALTVEVGVEIYCVRYGDG